MSEAERKRMRELDEAAEKAGGYVAMLPSVEQHIDIRKLLAYCKEKEIDPLDLTIREYNRFVIAES